MGEDKLAEAMTHASSSNSKNNEPAPTYFIETSPDRSATARSFSDHATARPISERHHHSAPAFAFNDHEPSRSNIDRNQVQGSSKNKKVAAHREAVVDDNVVQSSGRGLCVAGL